MRSTQRVTRHAGLRALRLLVALLVALLAAAVLASCSSGTSEGDPDSRADGISFEEYCALGGPALVDVAAHRRGKTVVVTWGLPRAVAQPRTFRVLRHGPGERWKRVGQPRLEADAARRFVDDSAPAGKLRYAVVEVNEGGPGPICTPSNVGNRCAVATVATRGTG